MTDLARRAAAETSVLEDESFHLQLDAGIAARFHEVHRAFLAVAGRSKSHDELIDKAEPGYRSVVGCTLPDPKARGTGS